MFSTPFSGPNTVHWKQKCCQIPTLAWILCTRSRNILNSLLWHGHCALESEVISSRYSGQDTVHWKQKCSQVATLARTLCTGSRNVLNSLLWPGPCAGSRTGSRSVLKQKCSQVATLAQTLCTGSRSVLYPPISGVRNDNIYHLQ